MMSASPLFNGHGDNAVRLSSIDYLVLTYPRGTLLYYLNHVYHAFVTVSGTSSCSGVSKCIFGHGNTVCKSDLQLNEQHAYLIPILGIVDGNALRVTTVILIPDVGLGVNPGHIPWAFRARV